MEGILGELKFDMEALFNTNFHLDWNKFIRLSTCILHNEFLFLGDSVIIPVNHDIDKISETHYDAVVGFELLLHAIKGEIIGHIVCQGAWWFKVSHKLKERRILILIIQVFNHTNQLYSDAEMVQFFAFVKIYSDLSANIFTILERKIILVRLENFTYHEHRCLVSAAISIFNCGVLATFYFGQLYVDLARSSHAKESILID